MSPVDAQKLLTICAAYDNRKPDPDAAQAWALALDGLRYEDCRDAVVQHYRVSREWIMPADVRAAVKRVRDGRVDHEVVDIPPGFDPDDTEAYQRLLAESRQAQADGRMAPLAEYVATRHVSELRGVLRSLPPVPVKPLEKSTEHDDRLAAARAELAARRPVPLPDPTPPPAPTTDESAAAVAAVSEGNEGSE